MWTLNVIRCTSTVNMKCTRSSSRILSRSRHILLILWPFSASGRSLWTPHKGGGRVVVLRQRSQHRKEVNKYSSKWMFWPFLVVREDLSNKPFSHSCNLLLRFTGCSCFLFFDMLNIYWKAQDSLANWEKWLNPAFNYLFVSIDAEICKKCKRKQIYQQNQCRGHFFELFGVHTFIKLNFSLSINPQLTC